MKLHIVCKEVYEVAYLVGCKFLFVMLLNSKVCGCYMPLSHLSQ